MQEKWDWEKKAKGAVGYMTELNNTHRTSWGMTGTGTEQGHNLCMLTAVCAIRKEGCPMGYMTVHVHNTHRTILGKGGQGEGWGYDCTCSQHSDYRRKRMQDGYHWWELPQASFFHDKSFVMTNTCLSHLLQQKCACRDKTCVATNMLLQQTFCCNKYLSQQT